MGYKDSIAVNEGRHYFGFSPQLWDIKDNRGMDAKIVFAGFSPQLWDIKCILQHFQEQLIYVLAPNYGI